MAGSSPDDAEHPPAGIVSITVLSIKPVKLGKIFALASVEVDIDGVLLVIHGIRAMRAQPTGTRIDLLCTATRTASGVGRSCCQTRLADLSEKPFSTYSRSSPAEQLHARLRL